MQQLTSVGSADNITLLPLFREPAHSVEMLCHSMNIVKGIVTIVNPGQIPVLTVDQPLYAIAKQIQWKNPQTFGENHFVFFSCLEGSTLSWQL